MRCRHIARSLIAVGSVIQRPVAARRTRPRVPPKAPALSTETAASVGAFDSEARAVALPSTDIEQIAKDAVNLGQLDGSDRVDVAVHDSFDADRRTQMALRRGRDPK